MTEVGTDTRETITARLERYVSSGKVAFYRQAGMDLIIGKREGIHPRPGRRAIDQLPL